ELKSFTQAAQSLGLPKASVSLQVQQLENDLRTRLLQRTTRQVQLTRDGTSFYERAKDLVADVDDLQSMFQAAPADISGRIRVDMPSRVARLIIIPRLGEFTARFPNVHIELGSVDRQVDLIHEGYDCVIRGGLLKDSNLIARKLGNVRSINVASAAYLKRFGTPRTVRDLDHHYLIHYVPVFGGTSDAFEYLDGDQPRTVKMRSSLTVNNGDAYVAACEAGLGIIQTPLSSLKESLRKGQLVEILPRARMAPSPVYLLCQHRRNLPCRVKMFMDWLEAVMHDSGAFGLR